MTYPILLIYVLMGATFHTSLALAARAGGATHTTAGGSARARAKHSARDTRHTYPPTSALSSFPLVSPSFFLILYLAMHWLSVLPYGRDSCPPLPPSLCDVSEFTSGMNPLTHLGLSQVSQAGKACTDHGLSAIP